MKSKNKTIIAWAVIIGLLFIIINMSGPDGWIALARNAPLPLTDGADNFDIVLASYDSSPIDGTLTQVRLNVYGRPTVCVAPFCYDTLEAGTMYVECGIYDYATHTEWLSGVSSTGQSRLSGTYTSASNCVSEDVPGSVQTFLVHISDTGSVSGTGTSVTYTLRVPTGSSGKETYLYCGTLENCYSPSNPPDISDSFKVRIYPEELNLGSCGPGVEVGDFVCSGTTRAQECVLSGTTMYLDANVDLCPDTATTVKDNVCDSNGVWTGCKTAYQECADQACKTTKDLYCKDTLGEWQGKIATCVDKCVTVNNGPDYCDNVLDATTKTCNYCEVETGLKKTAQLQIPAGETCEDYTNPATHLSYYTTTVFTCEPPKMPTCSTCEGNTVKTEYLSNLDKAGLFGGAATNCAEAKPAGTWFASTNINCSGSNPSDEFGAWRNNLDDPDQFCQYIADVKVACYDKKDNIYLSDAKNVLEEFGKSPFDQDIKQYTLANSEFPLCYEPAKNVMCKTGGSCVVARDSESSMYKDEKAVYDVIAANYKFDWFTSLNTWTLKTITGIDVKEKTVENYGLCLLEDQSPFERAKLFIADLFGLEPGSQDADYAFYGAIAAAIILLFLLLRPPRPRAVRM